MNDSQDSVYRQILAYHKATKHSFHRYARSAGYMDWENQPVPFRVYEGCRTRAMPFLQSDPPADHLQLYCPDVAAAEFGFENVAGFCELSMGLSAWKALRGHRWSLRINPSSGNLHPTELYLLLPPLNELPAGVYHYNPLHHALELRARLPEEFWQHLAQHFATPVFLVALSSIFWRESWKYGERAWRYCNHDAGHAAAALRFAAGLWGWRLTYLSAVSDRQVADLLGFGQTEWPREEKEHPDLLCVVHDPADGEVRRDLPESLADIVAGQHFSGRPNRLSRDPVRWEVIDNVADVTRKPETESRPAALDSPQLLRYPQSALKAAEIIRRRRSALAFDPETGIDLPQFRALLDRTLPRGDCAPFDLQLGNPQVHLLLFVHHVEGLSPGLYLLLRNPGHFEALREAMHAEFHWKPVEDSLPLYHLQAGDFRHQAARLSCNQDIAGDSAFSLGMLARFRDTLLAAPYRYRHLFWETGMIGQALYLEAEAQGVRGTGIGCYFDDPVHETAGLQDDRWQSLYHFTVGRPLEDPRLSTLPPYHHLSESEHDENR